MLQLSIIGNHIGDAQLHYQIWLWVTLKGKSQNHSDFEGLYIIKGHVRLHTVVPVLNDRCYQRPPVISDHWSLDRTNSDSKVPVLNDHLPYTTNDQVFVSNDWLLTCLNDHFFIITSAVSDHLTIARTAGRPAKHNFKQIKASDFVWYQVHYGKRTAVKKLKIYLHFVRKVNQ